MSATIRLVSVSVVLLGLAALPASASGQILRGRITLRADPDATPAATLFAARANGSDTVTTLVLSRNGVFELALPGVGRWAVWAERLGYSTTSPVLVEVVDSANVALSLEAAPVLLSGLEVGTQDPCRDSTPSSRVLTLWTEMSSQIAASRSDSTTDRGPRFLVVTEVREIGIAGAALPEPYAQDWAEIVRSDTAWTAAVGSELFADGQELGAGFVRPIDGLEAFYQFDFLVPGHATLFSDDFTRLYCLFEHSGRADEGLLRVGFEPADSPGSEIGIRGVATFREARPNAFKIDFQYRRLPRLPDGSPAQAFVAHSERRAALQHGEPLYPLPLRGVTPDERFGGTVEAVFVPTLGWIPHNIKVRYPIAERVRTPVRNRCCAMKDVWVVTKVRRATTRVLRVVAGASR